LSLMVGFLPSADPGDVPESFADIDKSVKMLGYKPTTNIDVGIRKFVEWYNEIY